MSDQEDTVGWKTSGHAQMDTVGSEMSNQAQRDLVEGGTRTVALERTWLGCEAGDERSGSRGHDGGGTNGCT